MKFEKPRPTDGIWTEGSVSFIERFLTKTEGRKRRKKKLVEKEEFFFFNFVWKEESNKRGREIRREYWQHQALSGVFKENLAFLGFLKMGQQQKKKKKI